MPDNLKIAQLLREAAQDLREKAEEQEKYKAIKCAQVLAGAKGIVQLKQLIRGRAR